MLTVAAVMVRKKMAELGWNQADVAREMEKKGVHVASGLVSRWLRGERCPDRERSSALEEIFGVAPKLWSAPAPKKRAA